MTPGVLLTKADVTGISDAGNSSLFVEAENALLGEKIKVEADLVVLAIGVVPGTRAPQEYLDGLTEAQKKAMMQRQNIWKKLPSLNSYLILITGRALKFLHLKAHMVLPIPILYVSSMRREGQASMLQAV